MTPKRIPISRALIAPLVLSLLFAFLLTAFVASAPQAAQAVSTSVVISQVYGGGGNSGATYKNDFIELYNLGPAPIDLSTWSVQYASTNGKSWQVTKLTGTIQPGRNYLVQEAAGAGGTVFLPSPDATGTIPMSGTAGKVALVSSQVALNGSCPGGLVDFVGFGAGTDCFEGSGPTGTLSNTTAAIRINGGATDTDNNEADFTVGAPLPHNSIFPFNAVGLANPAIILPNETTLLTEAVTPAIDPPSTDIAVSCNLSAIGGSSSQAFFDDGTNGDLVAGDNIFSFLATATKTSTANLSCSFADSQGHKGTSLIGLNVVTISTIGAVNGVVKDTDDGAKHNAAQNGRIVGVQGVIYEKTLAATSSDAAYYAFFIQNTAGTADGDANTSDGLYVFMDVNSTLPSRNGPYTPTVGDEIQVGGLVTEYFNMTELTNSLLLNVVRSGVSLDEVPPFDANPPTAVADANRYWERRQGMRGQVPANSIVLNGLNVFSPADSEIWLARPDSVIAGRADPFQRRAFRDAHPLDDNYDPNKWDGNGYRLLMGGLGYKATVNDKDALLPPARTFDTVTNAPTGGINYSFSKYRVEVAEKPELSHGVDPATNNPPSAADRSKEYNIVDYNVENLYDYVDNPFSGCDFLGNSGCPGVTPPFNYIPESNDAYQARLKDIALQIVNDLHSPDILMVQEVENQDICTVTGGKYTCQFDKDNLDGKPDVLQELAVKIAENGGPAYDAAFDRDSSDARGIVPSFLYRTDRVQLLPADPGDPVLGKAPKISYGGTPADYNTQVSNPKSLNAVSLAKQTCESANVYPRAADTGLFRIFRDGVGQSAGVDVYLVNNHFKSGPDTCVEYRTEEAKYSAAIEQAILAAYPEARVVVGGDLNVYPRPDDPFAPIGQSGSSDQLKALYDSGMTNLWDKILSDAPGSAYSYVYLGQAQTLDQLFVSPTLLNDLHESRVAHINSDFPADDTNVDVARGTSDHDPTAAIFGFPPYVLNWKGFFQPVDNQPTLNVATAGTAIPVKFSLGGDYGLEIMAKGYPASQQIKCDLNDPTDPVEQTVNAGKSSLHYDATTDTYGYVWKTDKAWAGTCRRLTILLTDGTVDSADFGFKQ